MKIDLEKGIKGLVVHHKPLNEAQLKRLLLVFDELYFLDPKENLSFLKEGAICYTYEFNQNGGVNRVLTSDGFQVIKNFSHVERPKEPGDSVGLYNVLHEGNKKSHVIPTEITPYFNGRIYKRQEEKLLDKFDSVYCRKYINLIDLDQSDFSRFE